jgi:hypothetical protein
MRLQKRLQSVSMISTLLNHEAPSLFESIARATQVRINDFNPQNLAKMAWSFEKLNHEAPSLLDAIARETQVRIDDFNPQKLSNIAFGICKVKP